MKRIDDNELEAGDFSAWLIDMQSAIRGESDSNVPCDGCTACCTSSQFIHIGPGETDTLAHIPSELLFPAPRRPRGHVLLGYDERGHCPMLIESRCSIYEHRPQTCRTYDCRVFPAAGLEPEGDDKALIARQSRRWRFTFRSTSDRTRRNAVRAASAFLQRHASLLQGDAIATNNTQLAVMAIEAHDAFLSHDESTGHTTIVEPDRDEVLVHLTRIGFIAVMRR
jgi:uncharacterized protein